MAMQVGLSPATSTTVSPEDGITSPATLAAPPALPERSSGRSGSGGRPKSRSGSRSASRGSDPDHAESLLATGHGPFAGGPAALHAPPAPSDAHRVMGVAGLVSVVFFNVCGGPFGAEEIVSSGGPAVGIASLLAFPWLWCIPMALLTAELATAFPCDGGGIVWVEKAFGPFFGFQEGYWNWVSGVVDNALYPILAADMVTELTDVSPGVVAACKVAAVLVLTVPPIFGLKVVDSVLVGLAAVVLIPFAIMIVIGIPQMDWDHLTESLPARDVKYGTLLHILFWNLNGFTGAGLVAGEVTNPSRTIPRAVSVAVVLVVLTYMVPLCVGVGANTPAWTTWSDGSFSSISDAIGGRWLGWLVTASSLLGGIGLFTTDLVLNSYALVGMSEKDLVPELFAWRENKYKAPWPALAASAGILVVLVLFDFDLVLATTNCLNCAALVLIQLAGIKLRLSHAETPRPFKHPCQSLLWFSLSLVPPLCVTIAVFISVGVEAGASAVIVVVVVAFGGVAYWLQQRLRGTSCASATAAACGKCCPASGHVRLEEEDGAGDDEDTRVDGSMGYVRPTAVAVELVARSTGPGSKASKA